ncbi:hypothetical protein DESC_730062 [Desulfosarcina cetonica]|nr:hypothetical protein DESC_730062 [Desulfosarcina cetonica]
MHASFLYFCPSIHDERGFRGFAGQCTIDRLLHRCAGGQAGDGIDRLAGLEKHQGRNRLDAVTHGNGLIFIDIALGEDDLRAVCGGQIGEYRRHGLAGAAPGRPEIDDNGFGLLKYLLVELIFLNFNDGFGHDSDPPHGDGWFFIR